MHLWPPEVQEGGVALLPELLVLLTLHASHPLHHLLAQLHGWRQWLWVAAQDVAEVNVEQLACKEDLNILEFLRMLRHLLMGGKKLPDLSLSAVDCPSVCLLLPGCMWWHSIQLQKRRNWDISLLGSAVLQGQFIWSKWLTTALDISVHHLWADAIGSFFTWCMLPKEAL